MITNTDIREMLPVYEAPFPICGAIVCGKHDIYVEINTAQAGGLFFNDLVQGGSPACCEEMHVEDWPQDKWRSPESSMAKEENDD